ncbi:unnamed protein product [Protopolystoma xenopodis]|uniref:Uncharacterized protein n=1 Tax=Protopolystoma xenopodis TaxID=117903 RepID=A0A448XRJ6_9PLAT|nr:unnamed protein product [Protopolystoma xenopodis]
MCQSYGWLYAATCTPLPTSLSTATCRSSLLPSGGGALASSEGYEVYILLMRNRLDMVNSLVEAAVSLIYVSFSHAFNFDISI